MALTNLDALRRGLIQVPPQYADQWAAMQQNLVPDPNPYMAGPRSGKRVFGAQPAPAPPISTLSISTPAEQQWVDKKVLEPLSEAEQWSQNRDPNDPLTNVAKGAYGLVAGIPSMVTEPITMVEGMVDIGTSLAGISPENWSKLMEGKDQGYKIRLQKYLENRGAGEWLTSAEESELQGLMGEEARSRVRRETITKYPLEAGMMVHGGLKGVGALPEGSVPTLAEPKPLGPNERVIYHKGPEGLSELKPQEHGLGAIYGYPDRLSADIYDGDTGRTYRARVVMDNPQKRTKGIAGISHEEAADLVKQGYDSVIAIDPKTGKEVEYAVLPGTKMELFSKTGADKEQLAAGSTMDHIIGDFKGVGESGPQGPHFQPPEESTVVPTKAVGRQQTMSRSAVTLDDPKYTERQPVGEWIKTLSTKNFPKDEPALLKVLDDLKSRPLKERLTKAEVQQMLNDKAPELETVMARNPTHPEREGELFVRDPYEKVGSPQLREWESRATRELDEIKAQINKNQNERLAILGYDTGAFEDPFEAVQSRWDIFNDRLAALPEDKKSRYLDLVGEEQGKLKAKLAEAEERLQSIREQQRHRYDGHSWAKQDKLSEPLGRTGFYTKDNPDGSRTLVIDNFQMPTEGSGERGSMPEPHNKRAYDLMTQSILNYARENGYRDVEWTTGMEQNRRWGVNVPEKKFDPEAWEITTGNVANPQTGEFNTYHHNFTGTGYRIDSTPDGTYKWNLKEYPTLEDAKKAVTNYTKSETPEGDLRPLYDKTLPKLMEKHGQGEAVGKGGATRAIEFDPANYAGYDWSDVNDAMTMTDDILYRAMEDIGGDRIRTEMKNLGYNDLPDTANMGPKELKRIFDHFSKLDNDPVWSPPPPRMLEHYGVGKEGAGELLNDILSDLERRYGTETLDKWITDKWGTETRISEGYGLPIEEQLSLINNIESDPILNGAGRGQGWSRVSLDNAKSMDELRRMYDNEIGYNQIPPGFFDRLKEIGFDVEDGLPDLYDLGPDDIVDIINTHRELSAKNTEAPRRQSIRVEGQQPQPLIYSKTGLDKDTALSGLSDKLEKVVRPYDAKRMREKGWDKKKLLKHDLVKPKGVYWGIEGIEDGDVLMPDYLFEMDHTFLKGRMKEGARIKEIDIDDLDHQWSKFLEDKGITEDDLYRGDAKLQDTITDEWTDKWSDKYDFIKLTTVEGVPEYIQLNPKQVYIKHKTKPETLFSKMPVSQLSFMAKKGDKEAEAELKRRMEK